MYESIEQLAKDAIDVQNACNPRGVARSMCEAMSFLADQGCGTNEISLHPVVVLFVSKLASLNHSDCLCSDCVDRYSEAYSACRKLAYESTAVVAR